MSSRRAKLPVYAANRRLILIFGISKGWKFALLNVESLLLRSVLRGNCIDDPLVSVGIMLSRRAVGISETHELQEMAQMLASLCEAAQRLPEGPERQNALREIDGYQRRLAALVARPLG